MTDLEMVLNLRRMRHLRRCNTLPTISDEDVAQHSYFVAMLAMSIGDEYNTYATEHNVGYHPLDNENQMEELKMEVVLRKALCHDMEETFVSDIPWNIKHMDSETHNMFEKAIRWHMDEVFDGTNTLQIQHDMNTTCKDGLEGELVKVVDMLELAIYSWEECSQGNKSMRRMLDKAVGLIKNMDFSSVLLKFSPLFKAVMNLLENPSAASTVVGYIYHID